MLQLIKYIFWIELRFIRLVQQTISKPYGKCIIYSSKLLTKRSNYRFYMLILLLYNPFIFFKTYFLLVISRYINNYLKHYIKEVRPFNHISNSVKVIDRKKYSYAFPSQSIQTYMIIYLVFRHTFPYLLTKIYFQFLLGMLFLTRIYRGLHYPHDFICSYLLAYLLYYLLCYLLEITIYLL